MMNNQSTPFFQRIRMTRSLSVQYFYNGEYTNADPSSFQGNERTQREDALLQQWPHTGYADGILSRRTELAQQENQGSTTPNRI